MTPDQEQKLNEIYEWMQSRKVRQLEGPVDDTSVALLGVPKYDANGSSTLTQSVSVPSTPTNIDVPAAYTGTLILSIEGVQYEIPYL